MKSTRRFFNVFIHKPLNRKMTIFIFFSFLLYCALLIGSQYVLVTPLLVSFGETVGGTMVETIKEAMWLIALMCATFSLLYILIVTGLIMYHINRMVGAAFSIERHLEDVVATGKFDKELLLRKGDYFEGIAANLNKLAAQQKK